MWGYRALEVPEFFVNTKKCKIKLFEERRRSIPMAVMLDAAYLGATLPIADIRDTPLIGAFKRFLSTPPALDKKLFGRFEKFVDDYISNLPILTKEPSFEEWIVNVNQTESRKQEYRDAWNYYCEYKLIINKCASDYGTKNYVYNEIFEKFLQISSFIKTEWYQEVKPNRCINPRSITYMPVVGPAYADISKYIFSLPEFIKYIPIADRPKYILDRLSNAGARCVSTDYKSFENSFTRTIQEAVEMKLYKHMLANYPDIYQLCHLQCIKNNIRNSSFTVSMDAARMSGEMCTSLGNGFTNLMLMSFFCAEHHVTDQSGVIEGDDGLFTYHGPSLTNDFFNKLGFQIEIDERDLNEASFCGNIFTEKSLQTLVDPLEAIATASYSMNAVGARPSEKNKLTYLMGYSLLCQYGNCPIVGAFARMQIRTTILKDPQVRRKALKYLSTSRKIDWWNREVVSSTIHKKILDSKISLEDRLMIEKLYCIPVSAQILIEEQIDQCSGLFKSDVLDLLYSTLHPDWVKNFNNIHYADTVPVRYFHNLPKVADLKYAEGEQVVVAYDSFYVT